MTRGTVPRLTIHALLYVAAGATLLVPAFVNGFPLAMGDTWRYVLEADGHYSWASSQFYSYLLRIFAGSSLWLVVVVQAAATVFVVSAFLRRVLGASHVAAATGVALLAITSAAGFFASLVMTDLMLGLGLVAAVTLLLGTGGRAGNVALAVVVAYATAAHPLAFALFAVVGLGTLVVLALVRAATGYWRGRSRVAIVAGGVAAGVVALTISNAIVWGKPTPNPHSSVAAFGYLYVHGDLADELANCQRWDACALPRTYPRSPGPRRFDFGGERLDEFNTFLFDDDVSPLWLELGGPTEFADTARSIVLVHASGDPGAYAGRVASSAWDQLFDVRALSHLEWMTRYLNARHSALLATYSEGDVARFEDGKQFRQTLDLAWTADVAEAFTALGAIAAAGAAVVGLGRLVLRRPAPRPPLDRALPAAALFLGLYVTHAIVVATSVISTPRYGGRMSWLLVLAGWAFAYAAFRAYGVPAVARLRGARVDEHDVAQPADRHAHVGDGRGAS